VIFHSYVSLPEGTQDRESPLVYPGVLEYVGPNAWVKKTSAEVAPRHGGLERLKEIMG